MGSTFEFEKCTCLLFFSELFFHVVDATIYILYYEVWLKPLV